MKPKINKVKFYQGPLVNKIIIYTIPILLTNMFNLFYNASDMVIVGKFAGKLALSAVGSTGTIINMIISLFMGLSVGSSILVSKYFAAQENENLSQSIHCSIAVAVIGGIAITILGNIFINPLLNLMKVPDDIFPLATLYLRIYFIGMPFTLIYNFAAAILRAVGDSKRPLFFLVISGVINVILNLIFVILIKMSVAGVATATIISQAISMILALRCLINQTDSMKLCYSKIKIYKTKAIDILKIGLPAGLQNFCGAISNASIQSAVNSMGSTVIAGNSASASLEGFIFQAMASFGQTNSTVASQCVGAGQYKRSNKSLYTNLLLAIISAIIMCGLFSFFKYDLINLYNNDP